MNKRTPSIETILVEAVEIADLGRRQAFIEKSCAGDAALRQRVERLVADHFRAGNFLQRPAVGLAATGEFTPSEEGTEREEHPPTEGPGSVIGPYKLLEQIGEGGMGLVYVAEQQQPVRRRVALKVIKPGMDSHQVVARFTAERQALAMMDHAHIAKIYDGGTTPEGRPYFVMELVRGTPITAYCDQHRLTTRQRLELFLEVCQAVQHAHQKGIIHRDLKPSNILVSHHDVTPVVKVIDFGIAKATAGQLADRTVYTAFAQMVGTPLYMSPEQAGLSDLDVDTRSDVYSLGVLLYELLTGTTPFDGDTLRKAGYDEMRRIIREDDPPRPSTRLSTMQQGYLSTVAEQRGLEPHRLSKHVRGELDWIVMKALEKDRNRRYESASAFAADVERYLNDEPVQACPPSAVYRIRKFARRNRGRLAAAAAVTGITLLAALVLGGAYFQNAARRGQITQAVAEDLKEADILQGQRQWAAALPALERASGRLEGSGLSVLQAQVAGRRRDVALVARLEKVRLISAEEPDLAAQAKAYRAAFANSGLDVAALPPEEVAQRIRASATRTELVRALDDWAYCQGGTRGGSEEPLRAIAQLADDDPWRRQLRDPMVRADRKALEALAEGDAVLAQPPESVMNLFSLLEDAGATPAGVRLLRRAQALHPTDFWITFQLGFYLSFDPATAADALGFCRAALVLRPRSPRVHFQLGDALELLGRLPEAEAAWRKALELKPDYSFGYFVRGQKLFLKKKYPEAATAFRRAVEQKPDFARAYVGLGWVLQEQKQYSEAAAAYRKAIELDPGDASAYGHLGETLRCSGDASGALAAYEQALKLTPGDAEPYNDLAWLWATFPAVKYRDPARAVASAKKAVELAPAEAGYWNTLGVAHYRSGDWEAAAQVLTKSAQLPGGGTANDFFFLAMTRWRLGEKEQARACYDKAVAWMDKSNPHDDELIRFRAEAAELLGIPKAPAVQKDKE